jgi:aspartyl-tRNA(Asn)/glutamyl-tRNA(Gln) amidotransferase subunit A
MTDKATALARIGRHNGALGAFTDVVSNRECVNPSGPLAGVPFAVKNLFDVKGLPTRAGSKINRDMAPAAVDATLIQRLEAAGAVLVGSLNMGEYAYDFTGENAHDGPSRNPHDLERMTGGSSGGSGAAVAAGLVPIALGSDTNGSIRVPSSLCGTFGLKPTYGRLSRHGTFPFVTSFDHLGPLADSVRNLALSYDAMQGSDDNDPVQAERPIEPTVASLDDGIGGLRAARLGGWFEGTGEAKAAADRIAAALGSTGTIELPDVPAARAAAFLITMAEGAALHAQRLRTRAADFDADVRDRLIAGTMIPASWIVRAHKLRRAWRTRILPVFEQVDILVAPATPMTAPKIGQKTAMIGGTEQLIRPNLGLMAQPISFLGLPVVAVPVWLPGATLPIAAQVIAAPWREDVALKAARHLEKTGSAEFRVAKGFE